MLSAPDGPEASKHLVSVAQRAAWSALCINLPYCLLLAGAACPACSTVKATRNLQVQQTAFPANVLGCAGQQSISSFPCRALDLAATKLSMMAALSALWLGGSILVGRHHGRPASAVWPGWREAVQPWLVSAAGPWAHVDRLCR